MGYLQRGAKLRTQRAQPPKKPKKGDELLPMVRRDCVLCAASSHRRSKAGRARARCQFYSMRTVSVASTLQRRRLSIVELPQKRRWFGSFFLLFFWWLLQLREARGQQGSQRSVCTGDAVEVCGGQRGVDARAVAVGRGALRRGRKQHPGLVRRRAGRGERAAAAHVAVVDVILPTFWVGLKTWMGYTVGLQAPISTR